LPLRILLHYNEGYRSEKCSLTINTGARCVAPSGVLISLSNAPRPPHAYGR
jgi:hypothetical protein